MNSQPFNAERESFCSGAMGGSFRVTFEYSFRSNRAENESSNFKPNSNFTVNNKVRLSITDHIGNKMKSEL